MRITKALIIADPWIGYILDGTKDWEMRSSAASHRGWFGLIRKGTGAVYGVAQLVGIGSPLSPTEMIATFEHHRIPEHMILSGEVAKWNTPWKLAEVSRLAQPVSYQHKSGAVTWVELDEAAIEGIAAALRGDISFDAKIQPATLAGPIGLSRPAPLVFGPASREVRWIGDIEINEADLRNNHFYLRELLDKFPADVVGGSNKAAGAPREVTIEWGGAEPVQTDIDDDKKIFRARGWIGAFYKLHRAQVGDLVVIEETEPYRYRASMKKPGLPRRTS